MQWSIVMYCVECGKEEKLYNNLCKSCFLGKTKFFSIPKVVKLTLCSNCSAWEKANHWEASSSEEEAIKDALLNQISIKKDVMHLDASITLIPRKTNINNVELTIKGTYEDLVVEETLETEVRIKYGTCGRCSRLSGSYFEAIIQLRGTNRALDDSELDKAENTINSILESYEGLESNAFLTKSECIHGGEDFYIGSSTVARQIAKKLSKEFSGKVKESSKLMGRKDGEDKYRVTFTVRVPEFRRGDFVELDKNIYKILNILPKRVTCLELNSGKVRHLPIATLTLGTILGGEELTADAVVVLDGKSEVQILDPDNFKTVELVKPENFKVNSETVKIFKSLDRIFLIPNML